MAEDHYTFGEVVKCTKEAVDKCLPRDQTYQPNKKALRSLLGDIVFASSDGTCRTLSEVCELSREEKADLKDIVVKLRVGPLYKPWITSG